MFQAKDYRNFTEASFTLLRLQVGFAAKRKNHFAKTSHFSRKFSPLFEFCSLTKDAKIQKKVFFGANSSKKRQNKASTPMGLPNIFAKIFLQDVKFLRIFSRNVLFAANPSYNQINPSYSQINQLFRFGFYLMNRNLLLFVAININIYILNFIDVFFAKILIFFRVRNSEPAFFRLHRSVKSFLSKSKESFKKQGVAISPYLSKMLSMSFQYI